MSKDNLKEKFEILSIDIDGYIGNVFCEENEDITVSELRQEMVCICEYMRAICDLMTKGNIESDYLGVAEVINKVDKNKCS